MPSAFRVLVPFILLAAAACSSKSDGNPATPGDAGDDSDAQACGPGAAIPSYVRTAGSEVTFPAGFLFGTATAGMQVEKGLVHADWYQWAQVPGHVTKGDNPDDGPDALAHIADDVAAMQTAGAGAYRFSIEWSRIYPTLDSFNTNTPDPTALASYHQLLAALKAAHIRPFVTLHHFATPDYLDDITKPSEPQTFERPEMQTMFAEFARRMGQEFGGEVDDWVTINEPMILLLGAYVAKGHPPGANLDFDRMVGALKKLVRTHAAVYDALHAADTVDAGTGKAANVSLAKHNRVFYPKDPCEPGDVEAAQKTTYVWNEWIYNAVVFGDWDDDLNGDYTGPNDKKGDPTLKGRVDWIGVNYYGNTVVDSSLKLPYVGGIPTYQDLPTTLPKTDMGWDVFPQGFRGVLSEVKRYGLPVYVTENGVGDSQDVNKSRYLGEHLWELAHAITDDGVDVRGYFYWSLIDNFEWGNGFCPRFGLFQVDRASPQKTRTPYKAASFYKQIATDRKLAAATIDALPAYSAPVLCGAP
jgi:beta-glucosidase/6-phospho-beta-glucosidase/beta-galactosidase